MMRCFLLNRNLHVNVVLIYGNRALLNFTKILLEK